MMRNNNEKKDELSDRLAETLEYKKSRNKHKGENKTVSNTIKYRSKKIKDQLNHRLLIHRNNAEIRRQEKILRKEKAKQKMINPKVHQETEPQTTAKKSIIKRIFLVLIPIVMIAAFINLYNSQNQGLAVEELLSTFRQAMADEDISTLQQIIQVENGEGAVTESDFLPFVRLYNYGGEYKSEVDRTLQENAESLASGNKSEDNFIKIDEDNEFNFWDKKYHISLKALRVKTSGGNFTIAAPDRIEISSEPVVLLPGLYDAYKRLDILELKNSITIDHRNIANETADISFDDINASIENDSIDVERGGLPLQIVGTENDNLVFVDNKNTNMTIFEFNSLGYTNLSEGMTLTVVSKESWGYEFSESQQIGTLRTYALPIITSSE